MSPRPLGVCRCLRCPLACRHVTPSLLRLRVTKSPPFTGVLKTLLTLIQWQRRPPSRLPQHGGDWPGPPVQQGRRRPNFPGTGAAGRTVPSGRPGRGALAIGVHRILATVSEARQKPSTKGFRGGRAGPCRGPWGVRPWGPPGAAGAHSSPRCPSPAPQTTSNERPLMQSGDSDKSPNFMSFLLSSCGGNGRRRILLPG